MNTRKNHKALIKAHVLETLTPRARRLAQLAWWDLWYGPLTGCDVCGVDHLDDCTCEIRWPGFAAALEELRTEINIGDLWLDGDCTTDREPQGEEIDGEWHEPAWDEIYHYPRAFVLRAAFGEVADYL